MSVDTALRQREAAEQPIRVGMVGAGATGRAIAVQLGMTAPGIRLLAVANRTPPKRLSIISLLMFLLALAYLPGAEAIAGTYITTFPLTEDPISEGGLWINGETVGLDWTNVRTTSGMAIGTMPGNAGPPAQYADSTAILAGTWGPNQTAQATVAVVSASGTSGVFEEVELRLRTTITAQTNSGYEINCSVKPSDPYMQVVKWHGPLASWTQLDGREVGCVNGDIIKATITGTSPTVINVYKNGSLIMSVTDSSSPYTSGSPSIGFYLQGATGLIGNYGLASFTASDEAASTPPSPPKNLKTLP